MNINKKVLIKKSTLLLLITLCNIAALTIMSLAIADRTARFILTILIIIVHTIEVIKIDINGDKLREELLVKSQQVRKK